MRSRTGKINKRVSRGTIYRIQWDMLMDNRELLSNIMGIQGKYNLPITFHEYIILRKQSEHSSALSREHLFEEIKDLAKQYNVPNRLYRRLEQKVCLGRVLADYLSTPSFPIIRHRKGKLEIILNAETDIQDPEVIQYILYYQNKYRKHPPKPVLSSDNPKRKDWRAVWIWDMLHPEVTRSELANLLRINRTTLQRALNSLDKELLGNSYK